MKVTHVSVTQADENLTPEQLIVQIARVSNPSNQHNHTTGPKLLRYCIDHKHWSPFEMVDWTVCIETSRAIAAQMLRHGSFRFQEFSQRYATIDKLGDDLFEPIELRMKGEKNRQGSGAVIEDKELRALVDGFLEEARYVYETLHKANVAPECARMILPLATRTRLYMKGSIRSWIHYLIVRVDKDAQKEHRLAAEEIEVLFRQQFPIIEEAVHDLIHP